MYKPYIKAPAKKKNYIHIYLYSICIQLLVALVEQTAHKTFLNSDSPNPLLKPYFLMLSLVGHWQRFSVAKHLKANQSIVMNQYFVCLLVSSV